MDWSFKLFASLLSISGCVMTSTKKTQNARRLGISFPPRPLLASCFRHFCHVIEQGVVLVSRYLHNFHICWGSSGTSFWLKMFLHLNVINYYRADTTSLSYFSLITGHPLFKTLDTPIFWNRNTLKYHVARIVHGFGTNYWQLLFWSQKNHVLLCSYQITLTMSIIVSETACSHEN